MSVIWDVYPALCSVSNGGLTLDHPGGNGFDSGGRATGGIKTSGKWYWEYYVNNTPGLQRMWAGLAVGAISSLPGSQANSWGYYANEGRLYNNWNIQDNGSTYGSGDVLGVAVDIDAGKIWVSKNGTWMDSGNPAAGTGENDTGSFSGMCPAAGGYDTGNSITLRALSSEFSYTPPSGFIALEESLPPVTIELNCSCVQQYHITATSICLALDQLYAISSSIGISLEQLYSMVLEIWLTQHYGDVPVTGKSLVQPYGNGSVLIKSLQQRWDHAPELTVSLEQPWSLPDLLQAVCTQSYGIVAEVLHLTCEQLYHINERSTLFATLLQPYIIAEETARLYQFDCRLYIDGERIPYHAIEWQAVDSEFVWSCDFSVKSRAIAEKCVDGAEITIVSAGDTWTMQCYDGWFLDKRFSSEVYRISGRSRSWDLSMATPLLGDIAGGLASEIVTALAAPHGISVDWQMVDGYIADGKITANDQEPSEIIKAIAHDAGGIVLSDLDGNLLLVAEVEIPMPEWLAVTPAQNIYAVLERISTSESKDEQKGYNSFDVSDQLASGENFRFEEERIDGRTKELRLFLIPLDADQQYRITHSSDHEVTVEPFGIVSLQINDELVEFKEGSGQTSKPVHGLSSVVWQKENLGGVTPSEDGILTAAVPGYSLLKVSYVTSYHKWIARDQRIEDVQFRAERVSE